MALTDEEAAAAAIATFITLSTHQQSAHDEILAILASGNEDSFVDTHQLFSLYNILYFDNKLLPRTELSWSPRLTLCAGICELTRDPETRKFTKIRVKLSEPLLKLRPRSDLLNTLLHECIHAYLFITSNFTHVRDDPTSGHGAGFQALASAINTHGNYEITQFHTFHDEVDSYRTHIWLCTGSQCRTKPPHFGLVKRAMNRAPGKGDTWWAEHQRECGGIFEKIAEPELSRKQLESLPALQRAGRQKNKIDVYIRGSSKSGASAVRPSRNGNETAVDDSQPTTEDVVAAAGLKRSSSTVESCARSIAAKVMLIACPICDEAVKDIYINEHLDRIHAS